jgi:hypothetical protein
VVAVRRSINKHSLKLSRTNGAATRVHLLHDRKRLLPREIGGTAQHPSIQRFAVVQPPSTRSPRLYTIAIFHYAVKQFGIKWHQWPRPACTQHDMHAMLYDECTPRVLIDNNINQLPVPCQPLPSHNLETSGNSKGSPTRFIVPNGA